MTALQTIILSVHLTYAPFAISQVNAGLECGAGTEDFTDWEVGDTIEAFNTAQKKRTLEEASASMSAALEDVRRQHNT